MITANTAPSTACPVAPLAIEAIALLHRQRLHEDRSPALFKAASDRLEKVEAAAAAGHATSQAGIFFQVCIALSAMDWWDTFDPDEVPEQQAVKRRAQDALESVALAHYSTDMAVLAGFYLPQVVREAAA